MTVGTGFVEKEPLHFFFYAVLLGNVDEAYAASLQQGVCPTGTVIGDGAGA